MGTYGFLGLGIMGRAMAANLVRAGYAVTVWNRSPEKCAPLAEMGAAVGETPARVIADCDVTFAMLSDPAAAESVCFGTDGVLDGMAPGKGYVDMSTIDESTSRDISTAVIEMGGRYLEAPVSGTKLADGIATITAPTQYQAGETIDVRMVQDMDMTSNVLGKSLASSADM